MLKGRPLTAVAEPTLATDELRPTYVEVRLDILQTTTAGSPLTSRPRA